MQQLVELQKNYDQLQELNAEVLAVFREEKSGEEGLAKSRDNTKATYPLLMDLNAEQTAAYSQGGFHTYVINPNGEVVKIIEGSLMKRASVEEILDALKGDS